MAASARHYTGKFHSVAESGQKASPKTLNDYLGAISAFLNWLVQSNRCEISPLAKVGKVAKQKMRFRRALEEAEVLKLILKGPCRLVYWVAVTTGLRAGEIKKLHGAIFTFKVRKHGSRCVDRLRKIGKTRRNLSHRIC